VTPVLCSKSWRFLLEGPKYRGTQLFVRYVKDMNEVDLMERYLEGKNS